jgi:hydroxymethylbilane synthase
VGPNPTGPPSRIKRLDAQSAFLYWPAPGQGASALEARESDLEVLAMLAVVDDLAVRAAVTAERALLHELEGGCSLPLGAYAELTGSTLRLCGPLSSLDGETNVRLERTG